MKGRWFFWIPAITYGLYYLINNVYTPSKVIDGLLWILFCIWGIINVITTVLYIVDADDFRDSVDDNLESHRVDKFIAFSCATVPAAIITINYYFDKYLTIRK